MSITPKTWQNFSQEEKYHKCYQIASSVFLCDNIPDGWHELPEEKQVSFIKDNVWQPFDYWKAEKVAELIDDHALNLLEAIDSLI